MRRYPTSEVLRGLIVAGIFIGVCMLLPSAWAAPSNIPLPAKEWQVFKELHGGDLVIKWDEKRGVPTLIAGRRIPLPDGDRLTTEEAVDQAARRFIEGHRKLLRADPSDLRLIQALRLEPNDWYLHYVQYYKGLEVLDAALGININEGNVVYVSCGVYPDVEVSTTPTISESYALEVAKASLTAAEGQKVKVSGGTLTVVPVYSADPIAYHLCWAHTMVIDDWTLIFTVVDAHTGQLLRKVESRGQASERVQGLIWQLNSVSMPDTTTVAMKNQWVHFANGDSALTDADGYYSLPGGTDVENARLIGPRVHVERTGGDEQYHNGPPNSWRWEFTAADSEEVNVFYRVNEMYDYFAASPILYSLQKQVIATVGYTSESGLAKYTDEGRDSYDFIPKILLGTAGGEQHQRDGDTIYHEFTHLVICEVSPQYITKSGGGGSWHEKSGFVVSNPNNEPQANAMNEGFADYFAASKSNSATLFEATPSFERNLATEPDSTWANTYSPTNDEHNNGMIIGQAAWDLRANIYQGQPTADKLIYNTIVAVTNSTPDDPDSGFTFEEFHDMLYIKDDDLYAQGDGLGNGTPHEDTIYDAFYTEHGITVSDSIADAIPGSTPKAVATRLPQRLSLSQNFPNPFNPVTVIRFELPRSSEVHLSIYNTMGQLVRRLAEGTYERGVHRLEWDSKDERGVEVASGVYFYRLEAGEVVQTRRMVLLR